MSYTFIKRQYDPIHSFLEVAGVHLSDEDVERLRRIRTGWNFYEGYHWEEINDIDIDSPQITVNHCKTYINKFVAFEFKKGFTIKMQPDIEKIDGANDPLDFLNEVWEYNKKNEKLIEFGQSKSVTGDAWLQAHFESPKDPDYDDPFGEYPNGKIRIIVVPSNICFPIYDDYDKDKLTKMVIMYLQNTEKKTIFGREQSETKLYRQVWTKDRIEEYSGKDKIKSIPNKYGMIPFKHIKNHPLQGRNYGMSDIDDMIPINTELNLKRSNVSEVIDYHSAPVTCVFGARVHQLERGANKVWGGLPKDARVENLKLDGELDAAQECIRDLKDELLEVACIPVSALGGKELSISNTSAIALQIILMPLLEKIDTKHKIDAIGLSEFNKIILKMGLIEGLISIPSGVSNKNFYYNTVSFESMLPKDTLAELQQLDAERSMFLTTIEEALERLGKDNIQGRIADIKKEMKDMPEFYGIVEETGDINKNKDGEKKKVNAGFQNGPEKRI